MHRTPRPRVLRGCADCVDGWLIHRSIKQLLQRAMIINECEINDNFVYNC
ncbi:hypothetical protein D0U02_20780 [Burkholderia pseudomallei]|uniref:Uncharacterized protein n=3 Tax=Burkholderia pseudomallei TaxID=28450 RepID=A0AAX0U7Q3_BURPE|nr:conserved hypothetical protein [Burkholderia pseudomallei 1106a]AFR20757.1 hypothetical protein BPC006_II2834 [Burkholderia pseudomallei BPC006]AUL61143.1 hypothetical protein BHT10_24535 [Burkholderia pseudomallei]EBA50349.1 conserved hypothetical protein [Burkholderia pseudomallei 305]EEH29930.1 conserved hypothetical protein [Burkholderia pseudomallei Pakistan 9]EES21252.1 conserved hypothetical protein [Burkholderia pseudomallei 1106b]EET05273.1 conserved hypothetical protein [Burkhold